MTSSVEAGPADSSASERVVDRVAHSEGVDPIDLETPLYEVIDADALDAMFATVDRENDSLRVEFTYCGHDLRVTPDAVTVVDGA